MFPDVLRSHDGGTGTFPGSNARAVNTRCKVCRIHTIDPRVKIGALFREETSALFLIEEDDRLKWKSLRARRSDRGSSV